MQIKFATLSIMETNELRYFACAARHENLQKASQELNISAGSISKAISKLEDHFGVQLFDRQGRSLVLNDSGRLLQRKAVKILQLIDSSKGEITGQASSQQLTIVGLEILLAHFAPPLMAQLCKQNPSLVVRLEAEQTEEKALLKVKRGEAHLAIATVDPSQDMISKLIGQSTFQTCVGPGHRYFKSSAKMDFSIKEILLEPFVCPESGMLGRVEGKMSFDGWRDDKYPRRVGFVASRLKVLENVVQSGLALAYLPDFFLREAKFKKIEIRDCSLICKQKIRLIGSAELLPYYLRELF